jgi:V/A-type H+/Na+-transporting ATPase subunit K
MSIDYGMVGPVVTLALSAIGSAIGCGIAGAASHGVMSRMEEGHAKMMGMSLAPSSQSMYGVVLTILMKNNVDAGSLDPTAAIGLGIFCGLGIMFSAIYQGKVCATAMQASFHQPGLYGKSWLSVLVIESFALFVLVFTIIMM